MGNIEEIETYSHIEWEDEFKEDVAMTMTGFSDILVRRQRLNLSGVYMKWILQMI